MRTTFYKIRTCFFNEYFSGIYKIKFIILNSISGMLNILFLMHTKN